MLIMIFDKADNRKFMEQSVFAIHAVQICNNILIIDLDLIKLNTFNDKMTLNALLIFISNYSMLLKNNMNR